MASIKKRIGKTGEVSYMITVSNGRDSDHKQILITETYKPIATTPKKIEKEVENFARDLEKRVKDGQYYSGEKMTFDDCVEVWKKSREFKEISISTQEYYTRALDYRISKYLGHLIMSKIKKNQIEEIYLDMEAKGLKATTIQKTHVVINAVFKYAFENDIISQNPCDKVKLPKIKEKTYQDIHYFTVDQAKTFLDAIGMEFDSWRECTTKTVNGVQYKKSSYSERIKPRHSTMWKAYFTLAIFGGFRRGELVGLTWDQVDFEENKITIDKAIARTKAEGQYIKDPKTKTSRRTIELPEECFLTLDRWRREQLQLNYKMGTMWNDFKSLPEGSRPVFTQEENGHRIDLSTPSHKFKEILKRYNESVEDEKDQLPEIRLHDLRHTSATILLSNNTDIETVSHRLGHSKASVTLDIYGHWTEENDKKASETLSRLFG